MPTRSVGIVFDCGDFLGTFTSLTDYFSGQWHPHTVLRTVAVDSLVADPCFRGSQGQHRCRKIFSPTRLIACLRLFLLCRIKFGES